jgi:hypothetical protein
VDVFDFRNAPGVLCSVVVPPNRLQILSEVFTNMVISSFISTPMQKPQGSKQSRTSYGTMQTESKQSLQLDPWAQKRKANFLDNGTPLLVLCSTKEIKIGSLKHSSGRTVHPTSASTFAGHPWALTLVHFFGDPWISKTCQPQLC